MVTKNPGGFWLQESFGSLVIGPNIFSSVDTNSRRTFVSGHIGD